jgi:hypothetical membrane protein
MVTIAMRGRRSQVLCWVGSGAAALYFGTQVVVGLITDDYSFLWDTASELGQQGAPHARLFAVGAVGTGIATLAAALGLILASKPSRTRRVAGTITLASAGIASVAAGVYPMPDSRHGGGAIGAGLFLLPFVSMVVTWPIASTRARTILIGAVGLCRVVDVWPTAPLGASGYEEVSDEWDGDGWLFELWDVSAVGDQFELAVGDQLGELVAMRDRNEGVLFAPYDERGCCEAVKSFAEAAVGDWPQELGRATHGPDELGGVVERHVVVVGLSEKCLSAGTGKVVKE